MVTHRKNILPSKPIFSHFKFSSSFSSFRHFSEARPLRCTTRQLVAVTIPHRRLPSLTVVTASCTAILRTQITEIRTADTDPLTQTCTAHPCATSETRTVMLKGTATEVGATVTGAVTETLRGREPEMPPLIMTATETVRGSKENVRESVSAHMTRRERGRARPRTIVDGAQLTVLPLLRDTTVVAAAVHALKGGGLRRGRPHARDLELQGHGLVLSFFQFKTHLCFQLSLEENEEEGEREREKGRNGQRALLEQRVERRVERSGWGTRILV